MADQHQRQRGLPIKIGEDGIGAVGVSGRRAAQGRGFCAWANPDKVADQLNNRLTIVTENRGRRPPRDAA
jgi:uncharacterized protein GlcG (DUF336 family)